MDEQDRIRDEAAIRALIGAHFDGLKWSPGTAADWPAFRADYRPDAALYPAARPVRPKTLDQFVERMSGLAGEVLRSFEEHTLGMEIRLFGNVAVVMAASEMLENGSEVNHDIHGFLLVKDEGQWRIAAHAWDKATGANPVPEALR